MNNIYKFTLYNNLRIIIMKESNSYDVGVFNILYKVGSKNENPNKTGIAHLFEHYMFSGSKHIINYDNIISKIGGYSNAFTSQDYTNYYVKFPIYNIETIFWLESDRMNNLVFSDKKLAIHKRVVIEEFKEYYYNNPYGDSELILQDLSYDSHPYKWCVIGKNIDHINSITLNDIKEFYNKYYNPSNAIISIIGNVNINYIYNLALKWFSKIANKHKLTINYNIKDSKNKFKFCKKTKNITHNVIYQSWQMDGFLSKEYYILNLISNAISSDISSLLYNNLIIKKKIFFSINSYITDNIESGLFIIKGKILSGIDIEMAYKAIINEMEKIKEFGINIYQIQKAKNKIKFTYIMSLINITEKAFYLALFEMIKNANSYNDYINKYDFIDNNDIKKIAKNIFKRNNSSVLYYTKK